ncbi:hypothetical protein ACF0H5_020153 [Mactra antiquata]
MRQSILVLGLVLSGVCCLKNIVERDKSKPGGVTYQVTLDVYSGREDPKWEIDHTSPFYSRIEKTYKSVPSTPLCNHLGYRGFLVKTTRTYGRKGSWTVGCNRNKELEDMLLKSCPHSLRKAVIDAVTKATHGKGKYKLPRRPQKRKKVDNQVCTTRFEPHVWNVMEVIEDNNCYNYATNRRTDTMAGPGRGSGSEVFEEDEIYAEPVLAGCVRDGLTRLNGPNPGDECLMVLVIWPGYDYHFYRLDDNGFWSHKPGETEAKDTDEDGERIGNIEEANHGLYTVFAGYLGCGRNVTIN